MKIKNLKLGSVLAFGQYAPNPNNYPEDIMWRKVSTDNAFITECVIDTLGFDASEFPDGGRYGQLNGNVSESNLVQFLNASGYNWFSPTHDGDRCPSSMIDGANPVHDYCDIHIAPDDDYGRFHYQCMNASYWLYDSRQGFLDSFNRDEIKSIVEHNGLLICLPTKAEISGKECLFTWFRKNARRASMSAKYRYDYNEHYCGATSYFLSGDYYLGADHACHMDHNGNVHVGTTYVNGVRPVVRINGDTEVLLGYDGAYRVRTNENNAAELSLPENFMFY